MFWPSLNVRIADELADEDAMSAKDEQGEGDEEVDLQWDPRQPLRPCEL
jgi:hypothetical protein